MLSLKSIRDAYYRRSFHGDIRVVVIIEEPYSDRLELKAFGVVLSHPIHPSYMQWLKDVE